MSGPRLVVSKKKTQILFPSLSLALSLRSRFFPCLPAGLARDPPFFVSLERESFKTYTQMEQTRKQKIPPCSPTNVQIPQSISSLTKQKKEGTTPETHKKEKKDPQEPKKKKGREGEKRGRESGEVG